MSGTLELPLAHVGRAATMHVSPSKHGGWDVSAEVDGHVIVHAHCSNWQRVERLRRRLDRTLGAVNTTRRRWPLVASLLLAACLAATVSAQPRDDMNAVLQARVADYLVLRDTLRQSVAPEHIIDPRIREISGALLAAKIRYARATAGPCDIVPFALADLIRDRLHRAFDPTEVDVLLMNLYPNGVPTEQTVINAHYADTIAVPLPVSVLSALPPLPGVLGYRLIGRDIALWDEEAEIVVDVMTAALPEPHIWRFLDVSSFALREHVRQGLRAGELDPREMLDDMAQDAQPGALDPVVGQPFDWAVGAMMPPSVLHALPALPRPLEYRFVGPDLVVIDVQTGYVRGILPDALPRDATVRGRA